jgi:hypothetical protein
VATDHNEYLAGLECHVTELLVLFPTDVAHRGHMVVVEMCIELFRGHNELVSS